jgi:colicin import membrane protein
MNALVSIDVATLTPASVFAPGGMEGIISKLEAEVRGPLTAWEEAEANRISGHENAVVRIIELARPQLPGANGIRAAILEVSRISDRDWQEFKERAEAAVTEAMATLNHALAAADQAERDAAELAELRRLKAEREEADRKADAERIAAQQAAERQAYEEWREKERAEKAERDKAAAVAAAIETERKRQEAEAASAAADKAREEAAERKRQENKKHRAKVHNDICADLIAAGVPNDVDLVQGVVKALAAGSVRHLSITY